MVIFGGGAHFPPRSAGRTLTVAGHNGVRGPSHQADLKSGAKSGEAASLSKGYPRMQPSFRARLHELARDRQLQIFTVAALVAATAAAAAPMAKPPAARFVTAVQAAVARAEPPASPPLELVWMGADVDGDGRSDFANPTGHEPRGHDA